jgi:hypothetical protein
MKQEHEAPIGSIWKHVNCYAIVMCASERRRDGNYICLCLDSQFNDFKTNTINANLNIKAWKRMI